MFLELRREKCSTNTIFDLSLQSLYHENKPKSRNRTLGSSLFTVFPVTQLVLTIRHHHRSFRFILRDSISRNYTRRSPRLLMEWRVFYEPGRSLANFPTPPEVITTINFQQSRTDPFSLAEDGASFAVYVSPSYYYITIVVLLLQKQKLENYGRAKDDSHRLVKRQQKMTVVGIV